jgi:glycosyltransferase involved in cell wall biosynthesis/SAM-dependent methyltransferase
MRVNTTLSKATLRSVGSVSVVITTYNHAAFLDDAIRSVVRQTIPAHEIIVVDDGSTDHPEAVVSRYPRVRLIRQENQGLSAARNTGLRAAVSDKIIFLDADDRLCPCAIQAGLECFSGHPDAGLVYGGYREFDAGLTMNELILRDIGPEPHLAFLRGNVIGMNGTVLFDRRRLLEAGGFDVTLRRCEDYDVYLRMSRIHPVAHHRAIVAEYRRHGNNMSSNSLEMLHWVQRVLERYRPPNGAGRAAAAWRRGRAGWRFYYLWESLWGEAAKRERRPMTYRIADAMRESPTVTLVQLTRRFLQRVLPRGVKYRFKRLMGLRPPAPLKHIRFGDFNRTQPISPNFGFDRGTPVDRYYIEAFLAAHSGDIRGRALEVGDASYCRRFGKGIVRQDVLHVAADNPGATIVGDLSVPGVLPEEAFDCLVIIQTLHLVYDMHAAVAEMHRGLKPGGILLLTCPGISQVDRGEWGANWFWSITGAAAERMFADVFGAANVAVEARGNVYAAVCFLEGLALEEVDATKLEVLDASYPVIVTVRARKPKQA